MACVVPSPPFLHQFGQQLIRFANIQSFHPDVAAVMSDYPPDYPQQISDGHHPWNTLFDNPDPFAGLGMGGTWHSFCLLCHQSLSLRACKMLGPIPMWKLDGIHLEFHPEFGILEEHSAICWSCFRSIDPREDGRLAAWLGRLGFHFSLTGRHSVCLRSYGVISILGDACPCGLALWLPPGSYVRQDSSGTWTGIISDGLYGPT